MSESLFTFFVYLSPSPSAQIGNDRLPMLADIAAMSEADRMSLLTRILDMSVPLSAEVKKFISTRSSGIRVISAKHLTQLQSLIFATVYLCQHFPTDLSIDFLYALLVNMLFMGYFSSSSNSSSTISTTASKLLEFGDKSAEMGPLMKKLAVFDRIPLYSSANYQARIVHQYNAWQNCLHNINFLASVLDLSKCEHLFNFYFLVNNVLLLFNLSRLPRRYAGLWSAGHLPLQSGAGAGQAVNAVVLSEGHSPGTRCFPRL